MNAGLRFSPLSAPRVSRLLYRREWAETMKNRIAVNPQIHFGKPCVAGTRIPVQNVFELVREGMSFAEIIRDDYPDLQPEDIRACLQYAIDVLAAEDIHLATAPFVNRLDQFLDARTLFSPRLPPAEQLHLQPVAARCTVKASWSWDYFLDTLVITNEPHQG